LQAAKKAVGVGVCFVPALNLLTLHRRSRHVAFGGAQK
jgi:hypothetical protein